MEVEPAVPAGAPDQAAVESVTEHATSPAAASGAAAAATLDVDAAMNATEASSAQQATSEAAGATEGATEAATAAPPAARAAAGGADAGDVAATAAAATEAAADAATLNPQKKRKVAMFLAYVGHGYQGMQRNPGAKTIEEELFKALHAAGGISDANNDDHGFMKIHWMRAARTDKGVSAVGQVVSLKMVLEPEGLLERINAALPEQIRVFGYRRATNGFDSRKHCDKRRYEYVLPEWAFDPRQGLARAGQRMQAAADAAAGGGGGGGSGGDGGAQQQAEGGAAAEAQGQQQGPEGQQQEQQQAEVAVAEQAATTAAAVADAAAVSGAGDQMAVDAAGTPEGGAAVAASVEQVGEPAAADAGAAAAAAAAAAESAQQGEGAAPAPSPAAGTSGGGSGCGGAGGASSGPFVFDDACTQRLTSILSNYEGTHNYHNFTIRKPASAPDVNRYILSFECKGTFEINGERWVQLVVVGQSFMLHQIRKMVGMALAVMRGTAPEECLKLALKSSADLNTPMAPELGLFLDECYFESYNKQWGELHSQLLLADFQAEVDAFKAQRLYPHIAARDAEEGVNLAWLRTLNEAAYKFSQWEQLILQIRQGGGRRPAVPGAGVASLIGGMESYGGHKRPHSDGGGRGGGGRGGGGRGQQQYPHKRQQRDFGGGKAGRVLPPPDQRAGGGGGGGRGGLPPSEYSD